MKYIIKRDTKEHQAVDDAWQLYDKENYYIVQADSEGWIPFSGDKCPLPDDVRCDLKFDTGRISSGAFLASKWEWNSPYIAYYRPFLTEQAKPVQEPERKCSECGNNENDLSLYCVRCLNNDGWHLIDPAQAGDGVNQQLLAALQKAESHLHAMMAHIDHKPRRFQEHCWQQVLDIRAAIAAAQEQGGGE
jgi:hypothetical protein